MALGLNVRAAQDYKELLFPKGAYEGKIVEAEEKLFNSGRSGFVLKIEIQDTIPPGQEIDEEEYANPLGKKLIQRVFWPMPDDNKNTEGMMLKKIRDLMASSGVEPESEDELDATEFLNYSVGVIMKHELVNKEDKNGDSRAVLDGFTTLPEA